KGLSGVRDAFEHRRPIAKQLESADAVFTEGEKIEHMLMLEYSGYAYYASALLQAPHLAHAAFQLAWIDRAFGSPITAQRVSWLRDLGIRDEALLGELATPPSAALEGSRSYYLARLDHRDVERAKALADTAEHAGLPSVAR